MGVVHRGKKSYYYVSERIAGRVTTHYLGSGPLAERCAALWAEDLREIREIRDQARAEKALLLAMDSVVGELAREARELAVLAMTAAGFHRPKGTWRRRRNPVVDQGEKLPPSDASPATKSKADLEREFQANFVAFYEAVSASKGGPKAKAAVRDFFDLMQSSAPGTPLLAKLIELHRGDPAKAVEEELVWRYAGDDLMCQEATRRSLAQFRSDLAGPAPISAIERVLIEQAAICWLASYDAEARAARTKFVAEGVRTPAEALFYQKAADLASRRLVDVLKALDLVRRKAVPAMQVNLTAGDIGIQVGFEAGDAATSADRKAISAGHEAPSGNLKMRSA